MSDEKVNAVDFSEMVFKTISEAEGLVKAEPDEFPWSKCDRGNHSDAEAQLTEIYAGIGLKAPRFAWSLSPPALFTAIQMLRAVHVGQRQNFINAMVEADDPIASAKRTLLDAITDRNVMTTMGAAVGKQMFGRANPGDYLYIWDLGHHLRYYDSPKHKSPLQVATPAKFEENTVYGVDHIGALRRNTLLFLPYVHICWVCEPPTETQLWPNGHLRMMKFADGYEVRLADPEANLDDGISVALIETGGEIAGTYGGIKRMALPEQTEVITRRVLFAMCSLGKHEGCSGVITEVIASRVETYCTCSCHEKKVLPEAK